MHVFESVWQSIKVCACVGRVHGCVGARVMRRAALLPGTRPPGTCRAARCVPGRRCPPASPTHAALPPLALAMPGQHSGGAAVGRGGQGARTAPLRRGHGAPSSQARPQRHCRRPWRDARAAAAAPPTSSSRGWRHAAGAAPGTHSGTGRCSDGGAGRRGPRVTRCWGALPYTHIRGMQPTAQSRAHAREGVWQGRGASQEGSGHGSQPIMRVVGSVKWAGRRKGGCCPGGARARHRVGGDEWVCVWREGGCRCQQSRRAAPPHRVGGRGARRACKRACAPLAGSPAAPPRNGRGIQRALGCCCCWRSVHVVRHVDGGHGGCQQLVRARGVRRQRQVLAL